MDNKTLFDKINDVYKSAKLMAEKYEVREVLPIEDKSKIKSISKDYAAEVNLTNKYRQKQKDLVFIQAMLNELKSNLEDSNRNNTQLIKRVTVYLVNIANLIKVYKEINDMQQSILKYYEKFGFM